MTEPKDNKTHDTEARLYTKNRKHIFENLAKNDKCYLYFDKKANVDNGSELLAKMQSEANTTTPDFSKAATTDEGIFIANDPMYGTNAKTYYWRGATTTNYVIFANKCWRILRINGDGTFRLIYDGIPAGTSCSINDDYAISGTDSFIYNSTANYSAYVGWTYTNESQRPTNNNSATSSNLKLKAELWYNLNIASNKEFALQVVDGKYCNDRNVAPGYVWSNRDTSSRFYYATYSRINTFSPTLSCSNEDIYTLKVGLITSDEVMYAGGTADKNNKTFYLYNAYGYWTMSPWGSNTGSAGMYFLNSSGSLAPRNLALEAYIRPVINLKDDITFYSGNGTQTNPYIVAD